MDLLLASDHVERDDGAPQSLDFGTGLAGAENEWDPSPAQLT